LNPRKPKRATVDPTKRLPPAAQALVAFADAILGLTPQALR